MLINTSIFSKTNNYLYISNYNVYFKTCIKTKFSGYNNDILNKYR